jgi:hypothetical protein
LIRFRLFKRKDMIKIAEDELKVVWGKITSKFGRECL